jgi:hypothetical protein
MNSLTFSIIIVLAFLHNSCSNKEENVPNVHTIDCTALEDGLLFGNEEAVALEINQLSQNYPPVPTDTDDIGHEENLDSIVSELNNQCQGFVTELGCYACAESYPPQSTIYFTLDSAGIGVKRFISLLTPRNDFMTFR